MMYIEIVDGGVRVYLDHSPKNAERWTFEDVLAGKLDAEMRNQIGPEAAEELKAAVRREMTEPKLTPEEAKRREMLRRRAEGSAGEKRGAS
jgi:hypothetical protein